MGSKAKNVIGKRRPRQNIIAMILKNAKSKGSVGGGSKGSTSFSTASTSSHNGKNKKRSSSKSRDGNANGNGGGSSPSQGGYRGSKKGILQSAVELTRRSKRVTGSRSGRGKSRGRTKSGRSIPFAKGQKAFYRSAKGIAKVTVVGIHHDAKLEPYYTIKLRDGKEKQTDGKHLTAVQADNASRSKSGGKGKGKNVDGNGSVGGGESVRDGGSASSSRLQQRASSPAAPAPEVVTDHMTESSSEAEELVEEIIIEEVTDDEDDGDNGGGDDDENRVWEGNKFESSDEDDHAKAFEVGQDAYYRRPDGGIAKVRILSRRKNRYDVSLPDGTTQGDVRASRIATLMDLTSKELSALMKERNRQREEERGDRRRGRGRSRGKRRATTDPSSRAVRDGGDAAAAEDGAGHAAAAAEAGGTLTSSGAGGSLAAAAEAALALALPPAGPVVKMVEAKTEEGGTKMVPMYDAGMHVRYKNAAGIQPAEILDVHFDDLMEPYYSIRLEDGREKQTDNAHILMEGGGDEEEKSGAEPEQDGPADIPQGGEEVDANRKEEAHHQMQDASKENVPNMGRTVDSSDRSQDPSTNSNKKQDPQTFGLAAASVASALDPVATPSLPANFVTGDEVFYKSSQGEQFRAVILQLHLDKKNRPYYAVRLRKGDKIKQVYGHRLRPYVREERNESLRRSRSRSGAPGQRGQSKATSRGRGSSKPPVASGRGRGSSKRPHDLRRSTSIGSHRSATSNSNSSRRSAVSNTSRRSRSSRERFAGAAEGSPAPGRGRHGGGSLPPSSSRGRDESVSSRTTRDSSRTPRSRSRSVLRRIKSTVAGGERGQSLSRRKPSGRARSRSLRSTSADDAASLRSAQNGHQFTSAHHHHAMASGGGRSRRAAQGPLSSSKTSGGGDHVSHHSVSGDVEEQHPSTMKGRSISRLKSFRKSYAGRKKKH